MKWERWPAAEVEPTELIVSVPVEGGGYFDYGTDRGFILVRGRRGGAPYEMDAHGALWRTHGEILMPDAPARRGPLTLRRRHDIPARQQVNIPAQVNADRLCRFVRAYGPMVVVTAADTLGAPPTGDKETFGYGALLLAGTCRDLAAAWAMADDDVSRRQPDERIDEKALIAHSNLYKYIHGENRPPAGTLLDFMVRSAVQHFNNAMSMRRCLSCGNWIALTRSDRFYCDVSCRMARGAKGQRGRRRNFGEA